MIENLTEKDISEAARVYNRGILMQVPKGYSTLNETIQVLKNKKCFIYKINNKIVGLVVFDYIISLKRKIKIDFICVLKLRKGIGRKLIKRLVDFSLKNKVQFIYSNVSSKDKRVMQFYEYCGFKKYGKYYASKNFLLYRIRARPIDIKKRLKIN